MTSNMKSVVRDALTVYGLTFVFGLGSAIAGFNMQSSPSTAYRPTCCREQLVLRWHAFGFPPIVSNT